MSFSDFIPDLIAIGPELILCATILVVLLVDLWRQGRDLAIVWLLAPLLTFLAVLSLFAAGRSYLEHPPAGAFPTSTNPLMPEFIAIVLAYATVTIGDLWFHEGGRDRWVPGTVVLIGTLLAGYRLLEQSGLYVGQDVAAGVYWGDGADESPLVTVDAFSIVFRGIVLVSLAVSTWFTIFYRPMQHGEASRGTGEFFACLVGAHVGGMFLVGTTHLLFIFLALETMSLCSYMQAGMIKGDRRSAEAGLKYILYGSVASGLMLFGFSLLYAFSGDMTLRAITATLQGIAKPGPEGILISLGLLATVGGLAYKLSIVPFHFWAPDVYEGSPTPTTAFLSVGSKAASFGILLRLLYGLSGDINWTPSLTALLAFASAITMTYGNLAALRQPNLKRLLAYSTIAHAGYMLMGVVALYRFTAGPDGVITASAASPRAYEAIIFYLIAYLLMNLGAFGVVIYLANKTGSEDIMDIRGLGWKSPWAGGAMVVFLLSLTGIPPTAGFFAKYYLFIAAIDAGFLWLAIIAVINTVISLFFYFRIAKELFLRTEDEALYEAPRSVWLAACLILLAAMTVWIGVFPQTVSELTRNAMQGLAAR